jgi:hypothetical protein
MNLGYKRLFLLGDGDQKCYTTLAALRLSTFIGLPPTKHHTADHIDRNRSNDSLSNLRWADKSLQVTNRDYSDTVGKQVPVIATRGDEVRCFNSFKEACIALNVSHGNISRVIKGEYKQTGGWSFKYQYIDDRPGEEWKLYGNKTHVSNHGRVKREVYGGFTEVTLRAKSPYFTLVVGKKKMPLHHVVVELFGDFIERRRIDPTCEVDHKDSDTRNNHISNLRIMSLIDHQLKTHAIPVIVESIADGSRREFPSLVEAAKYMGVKPPSAQMYLKGEYKSKKYRVIRANDSPKRLKTSSSSDDPSE